MKVKFWLNNDNYAAGMTLRDNSDPECSNMALHVCRDEHDILRNRVKLAKQLHCEVGDFVCAQQTHSTNFYKVTTEDRGRGSSEMENAIVDTDALYTRENNLLLCCFTADCVPVVLIDEKTGLIGVVHSGWQGTVKEIAPKLLKHLIQYEHCSPADFKIYIGGALSKDKFEVDEDVFKRYQALTYGSEYIDWNEEKRKYLIDNQMIVRKQCELHGINPERIQVDRTCTYLSDEGFSYRQDKNSGRHLIFIMKRD